MAKRQTKAQPNESKLGKIIRFGMVYAPIIIPIVRKVMNNRKKTK